MKSAFHRLDEKISPTVVEAPRVSSFHQFLTEVAKVRLMSVEGAGTYAPYTFKGREALEQIVHVIDFVLGSKTGVTRKDALVALAGGAQFGKTTLELNLSAYLTSCRGLNPIVFLPDDKLADDIVDAKFRPDVIDQVPWFAEMTKVGRAVNKSGKAVNTKGAFLVTDGKRKAVGMFRGLRKPPTSFSADVVVEDEKDDIPPKMAKFIGGRMTASATRFHLVIGTQRVHGAGQNKEWEAGSQGVVLLGTAEAWAKFDSARYVRSEYGHEYVTEVPPRFINPEEAWPKCCRSAVTGEPRKDDPVLGWEGDFRRPGSDAVVDTYRPGGHYYYAHPETGEPLLCGLPLWHHRKPEKLAMLQFTFRVAQIGTAAIDLQQIVAHWLKAVGDSDEMVAFRCDRQAIPKSAAQALTPEILDRSRRLTPYCLGDRSAAPTTRFAGLDTGDHCWYVAREIVSQAEKRILHAAKIAVGDVVSRVTALVDAQGISTLFIDERPAVSEARTLALILNGLSDLEDWPAVDWKDRGSRVTLPSGLTWEGSKQRWLNLRCAVVRFTKTQLGAGIDHGAVEFQENGLTKFVPMIACNRFETIDRVVKEFLTPAENVIEVVDFGGKKALRTEPAMRMPLNTPGAPSIVGLLDSHFLAGSQRVKDEKSGELGDYVDGIANHLLFADGYSGLAELVGGTAKASPIAAERIERVGSWTRTLSTGGRGVLV